MNEFEKEMLEKIDAGIALKESELKELVFEFFICDEEGDQRRWVQGMFSVVELGGRTFGINWDRALTECQEHAFYNQPYEVKKTEKEITITKVTWEKV